MHLVRLQQRIQQVCLQQLLAPDQQVHQVHLVQVVDQVPVAVDQVPVEADQVLAVEAIATNGI